MRTPCLRRNCPQLQSTRIRQSMFPQVFHTDHMNSTLRFLVHILLHRSILRTHPMCTLQCMCEFASHRTHKVSLRLLLQRSSPLLGTGLVAATLPQENSYIPETRNSHRVPIWFHPLCNCSLSVRRRVATYSHHYTLGSPRRILLRRGVHPLVYTLDNHHQSYRYNRCRFDHRRFRCRTWAVRRSFSNIRRCRSSPLCCRRCSRLPARLERIPFPDIHRSNMSLCRWLRQVRNNRCW